MTTTITLLAIPWLLLFVYWTVSIVYQAVAGKAKTVEKRGPVAIVLLTRLFLYASIILVFGNDGLRSHYPLGLRFLPSSPITEYSGLTLATAGILFSIWGRASLGGNWSADAELKVGQTLVRTGPYGVVRHPIYAGMTLGVVGSVIAENDLGALIAIPSILIFSCLRIVYEEKMMGERFAAEWDSYTRTVKRFVPWIW